MIRIFLKRLFHIGVNDRMEDYLRRKVSLSNRITATVFPLTVGYIFFSLKNYPELTFLPVSGVVICLVIFLFNWLGLIYLSRIITGILPIVVVTLYHAYVVQPGESPLLSSSALGIAFTLIPFIVFDLREKIYLYGAALFNVGMVVSFPLLNDLLHMDLDSSIMRGGTRETVLIGVSVVIIMILGYMMNVIGQYEVRKVQKLKDEMDTRNEELEKSQLDMERYLEQLKKSQAEEKKRNWASIGLAEFSEIQSSEKDITMLCDRLISKMVNYTSANQGGLFIVNEDGEEPEIRLMATYAYDRKKFKNKVVEPGEGMLGMAFLEKEYVYRTEIPQFYVEITSGLGNATPNSLLIMPMIVNDKVEGLFELASFKEFEPHEIEFIQKVGETIAVTFQNNKINERTKVLLEESQRKEEDLRSQEEEMRQNLEELQATQEEMQRITSMMQQRMEAVNTLVAYAEFSSDGILRSANQWFEQLLKYTNGTLEGKQLSELTDTGKSDFNSLMDHLQKAKIKKLDYAWISSKGETVYLTSAFYPILDADNEVQKIITYAHESVAEGNEVNTFQKAG